MKSLLKIVLILSGAVGLTNCKLDTTTPVDPDPGPEPYLFHAQGIEYSNGGWYPGPSGVNFDLVMSILIIDGSAIANVQVPGCSTSGQIKASDFNLLVDTISKAPTKISDMHVVDAGDEQITIDDMSANRALYMRDGDHSYGHAVIVQAQADNIRQQLHAIADQVLAANACNVPMASNLKSLHITQNLQLKIPVGAGSGDQAITDLNIDVNADSIVLNGTSKKLSGTKSCSASFSKKVINDARLVAAAQALHISATDAICMIAPVNPTYGTGYSPLAYTFTYADSSQVTGYFSCAYGNQVSDPLGFDTQLTQYINPTACVAR